MCIVYAANSAQYAASPYRRMYAVTSVLAVTLAHPNHRTTRGAANRNIMCPLVKPKTLATLAAVTLAVVLLPRVYLTAETLVGLFPIDQEASVFVDLDPAPWYRALFIAAHACVAWFVALWWRGTATLWLKTLTLLVLVELIAIYLMTLRFWHGGVEIPLY